MKKVALAVIKDNRGKFLLQHKDKDAPNNPDMWCLFGGGIEPSEMPDEAIVRELFEELQVKIRQPELLAKLVDEQSQIERYYYAILLDTDAATLKKQLREGDDVDYWSIEEIAKLKVNPAHHEFIKRIAV